MTDKELLDDYWAAHAQFGPCDVSADEYVRLVRKDQARRRLLLKHSNTTPLERVDWAGIVRLMEAREQENANA